MLKNKRFLLILITIALLFILPSICNAAETNAIETTTTSTGKTVKWSYELEGDSIVNLKCINKSEVSGEVVIPSTLDGHTVVGLSGGYRTGIFEECEGITGVTIPDTINNIPDYAFNKCDSLTEVILPDGLLKIGFKAFYSCSSLNKVTLPNSLTTIGGGAFRGTGITNITIPNGVIKIDNDAFYGCSSLKNIVLNNGLINIGESAFRGTGIQSITIPDSVTSLGAHAFQDCTALTQLTLSQNLTRLNVGIFSGCKGLTSVIVPKGVTTIASTSYSGDGAFSNCVGLKKVLIPDSVVTIENNAFKGCNNLTIYGNDNQESKRYAEDNKINFDYIANWDKAAEGSDITPLKIKSLEIAYSSIFKYDSGTGYYLASAGTNISIKATFEEIIHGTTAPKLTIRCGNGANIELTNGVIQSSNIVYTYQIKEQDKGIISAVSMTGGDIKDEAGNKAEEYTCPEIVTDAWQRYVYANGTGSTPGNQENNGNNNTTVTLTAISITKVPTKVSYTEGEKFDKTGMVITATYSDGTTKNITNYSISPSGALKTTDKKVTITYTENGVTKTVEQKVTVTEKETNDDTNKGDTNTGNDDGSKDSTTKDDDKIPQTGVAVLSVALISLTAVAVISKIKYGAYKDI